MQWGEYRNHAHHSSTCEFHVQHEHDYYDHYPALVYHHELFKHDNNDRHTARFRGVLHVRLPRPDPTELVGESRFPRTWGGVPR